MKRFISITTVLIAVMAFATSASAQKYLGVAVGDFESGFLPIGTEFATSTKSIVIGDRSRSYDLTLETFSARTGTPVWSGWVRDHYSQELLGQAVFATVDGEAVGFVATPEAIINISAGTVWTTNPNEMGCATSDLASSFVSPALKGAVEKAKKAGPVTVRLALPRNAAAPASTQGLFVYQPFVKAAGAMLTDIFAQAGLPRLTVEVVGTNKVVQYDPKNSKKRGSSWVTAKNFGSLRKFYELER